MKAPAGDHCFTQSIILLATCRKEESVAPAFSATCPGPKPGTAGNFSERGALEVFRTVIDHA
jgi:hypothetical protein